MTNTTNTPNTPNAFAGKANAAEPSKLGLLDAIFCELGVDDSSLPDDHEDRAEADSGHWVLHVDDDRDFTEVVRHRLQPLGISVVSAYDDNGFAGKTILIADDDQDLLRILESRCEQRKCRSSRSKTR